MQTCTLWFREAVFSVWIEKRIFVGLFLFMVNIFNASLFVKAINKPYNYRKSQTNYNCNLMTEKVDPKALKPAKDIVAQDRNWTTRVNN